MCGSKWFRLNARFINFGQFIGSAMAFDPYSTHAPFIIQSIPESKPGEIEYVKSASLNFLILTFGRTSGMLWPNQIERNSGLILVARDTLILNSQQRTWSYERVDQRNCTSTC